MTFNPAGAARPVLALFVMLAAFGAAAQDPELQPPGDVTEGGRPPVHPQQAIEDGAEGGRPPVHPERGGDDRTEGGRPPVHPQLVADDSAEGGRPPVHPQCVDSFGLCLMGAADKNSLHKACRPIYKDCKWRTGARRTACATKLAQCELDAIQGGRPPVHPQACETTLMSCQANVSTD